MGGLGIWLRAEARRRWRAWLAVALIAGVGWGVVLTAVAGARRTDTAYARFRDYSRAHDVLLSPEGTGFGGFTAEVAKLPAVVAAGGVAGLNAEVIDPRPPEDFLFGAPLIALDDRYVRTIDRPKLIRGRLPDPASPSEALVSPSFARGLKVDVGTNVTLQPLTSGDPETGSPPVYGKPFVVRIVGIGVTQNEAFPVTTFDRIQPLMLLTPAAFRVQYTPEFAAFDGLALRLRAGTDVAAFQQRVGQIQSRHPESGSEVFFASEAGRPAVVRRALRPQVAALIAFAGAVGITLILVVSQTVARQISLNASEYPALRAVGMSTGRLMMAAVVPAGVAALAAAAIAVAVAIAASPLTPIGAARLAEPYPGVAIDLPVLTLGALALLVWFVASSTVSARRAATPRAREIDIGTAGRGSRVAAGLARAGLPAPASAGVRMALEPGRGSTAVPVRTVVISAVVSIVTLSAAYTFGASLDHTVTTPRLFGQRWDTAIDGQFDRLFPERLGFENDPSLEAVAGGVYHAGPLVVEGRAVAAIGIDDLKGSAFPTLLEGRPPRTPDEIVLGTSTLGLVGGRVGGTVSVAREEGEAPMRIVGRAVLPAFGIGSFTPTGLGEGAILTADGLQPTFLAEGGYSFVLVRFSSDASADAIRRVDRSCDKISASHELCLVRHRQQPPEIESYAQVRGVTWLLAGVLGALAAATLAHGLLATVRRRRRDLAILKTLGFVRRQISSAVAWQATTFAVLALIGIPLGIMAGRWIWTGLASQLGIPGEPRVPPAAVGLTIPAVLLLANLVAALPGRAASRTQAALVLRTE